MHEQKTGNKGDGSESRPCLGHEAAEAGWRSVYLVVLGTLVVWVGLLTLLTRLFS